MQEPKAAPKKHFRLFWILVVLLLCIVVSAILTQSPLSDVVYRFVVKTYANYELALLKYPNSQLVRSETSATTKTTMATDYTYRTSDEIDTVLAYMEQQLPGFVYSRWGRVVNQSTYKNRTRANETILNPLFSILGRDDPSIEVNVYSKNTGETMIMISVHWDSMGFPSWLRAW